jgi:ABC-2 type transport system ATP-binding protein
MKILSGRLEKTNGEVSLWDENPMNNLNVLNKMVYNYHNVSYGKNLTLKTILQNYSDMFSSFDHEFALKLLHYFELSTKMKYTSLSQGMGSIFNFICALSCRCPITMLDEPVLGMDVTVRKSAYEILLKDYAEYPRTFIISSHLLNELEGILSDILLIDNGALILHDSIDEIRQSAYRIDGDTSVLMEFSNGRNVIAKQNTPLQSYMIIKEPLNGTVKQKANARGISVSSVRPEDLCVYLTKQDKEDELSCLWTKSN